MTCDYEPRRAAIAGIIIRCPRCQREIVTGVAHIPDESETALRYLELVRNRPELPSPTLPFHAWDRAMAPYRAYVAWKGKYEVALAQGFPYDHTKKPKAYKEDNL